MTDKRIEQPPYLMLGRILRPHGIRGEMRMEIITDYPERLLSEIKRVYLHLDAKHPNPTPYDIETARFHPPYLLVKFVQTPTRDEAELLRDHFVLIDYANAVPLADDEMYLYQLIGMVVEADGERLGTIKDVLETGANDVYILESATYGELLIPAHDETILEIDLEAGVILMKLPEGLLPNVNKVDDEGIV